jgi:serine protease
LTPLTRRLLTAAVVALSAAPCAHAAGAADAPVPGRDYRAGQVVVRDAEGQRVVHIRDGASVRRKAAQLERRPGVRSASPNWIAHASFIPDDPGRRHVPRGWRKLQWNFVDPLSGVNAPEAWDNLIAAGRPGGKGVVVAVVDTGVAYRDLGRYKRSPDLTRRIEPGRDFVGKDRFPVDENGHGTHVASTIAEATNNGVALTGLAYGVTLMPVRVLNRRGDGDSAEISAGIRYAARHGADVINLSFEFGDSVGQGEIPDILAALRFARRHGALVVGAAGNASERHLAYPARAGDVMSVGAITEHGCQAEYSNTGGGLDIAAPGGGEDADLQDDPDCDPDGEPGRDIYQLTFTRGGSFGYPSDYEGTSMAAPHVSATAALVIASGVLGLDPSPARVERRLERTATDLGAPGRDPRYGAGKVDAAAATAPF